MQKFVTEKSGILERLSELESENLMSRLWEGLWERIIVEKWKEKTLIEGLNNYEFGIIQLNCISSHVSYCQNSLMN